MSSPRVDAASVEISGKLWVTGGQSPTQILSSTEFYSFDKNAWTKGPELPIKVTKHSMAALDNNTVLICGGK